MYSRTKSPVPLVGITLLCAAVMATHLMGLGLGNTTGQQMSLRIIGDTWQAGPGATIVHTLILMNEGGAGKATISTSGGSWPSQVPGEIEFSGMGSVPLAITVTVPFSATTGMVDAVDLTATDERGSQTASIELYTSTTGDLTGTGYVGCRFDLTQDGAINDEDVERVAATYGSSRAGSGYVEAIDFDHDGRIGAADVQAVAGRVGSTCAVVPSADSEALRKAVTVEGVRQHLEQLEAISDANGGNRSVATEGYRKSMEYVMDQMGTRGLEPTSQQFDVDFWEELSPSKLERIAPDPKVYMPAEFALFGYSGSGDVTAMAQGIDLVLPPGQAQDTSTSACEPSDFTNFVAGRIALVQRGGCSFIQKVANAQDAGATGVLLFNEGQAGRTGVVRASLYWSSTAIPVFGTSFEVGKKLATLMDGGQQVRLHMFANAGIVPKPTYNALGELTGSDPSRVILVGAHLDSVSAGAGINDNGSGSALVLEIAQQMALLGITPHNTVRFAFWGAEERGLLGSAHYVSELSAAQRDDIMLYLNFDMVGSPNYVRFVYDGAGLPMPGGAHPGAEEIESVFVSFLGRSGLAWEPASLGGGSDHAPFAASGIPAGGLFTGAGSQKSAQQAAIYGGTEGEALDPCYHRACDRVESINFEVLGQFAEAAAHTVLTYAMDERDTMSRPPSTPAESVLEELEYRGPQLQR